MEHIRIRVCTPNDIDAVIGLERQWEQEDIAYGDFRAQSPINIEPSMKGAENILALFPGGSTKVEDYIDISLLDEIKREGFIAAMEQKYKTR